MVVYEKNYAVERQKGSSQVTFNFNHVNDITQQLVKPYYEAKPNNLVNSDAECYRVRLYSADA